MKASELIARLQKLISIHGDQDIRIFNPTENEFDEINEIEPRRFLEWQRASDDERKTIFFGIDTYAVGDWSAQLRYDNVEE